MTPGREAHGGGDDEDDRDGRRGRGRADLLRGVRRHDDPHLLKCILVNNCISSRPQLGVHLPRECYLI